MQPSRPEGSGKYGEKTQGNTSPSLTFIQIEEKIHSFRNKQYVFLMFMLLKATSIIPIKS